ncbi:MAG TPA: hypothetical protein VEZ70_09635 [Allosphingosinicella sp.]|nr:hypothetical protein [Allosphingosinicella sp.]
MVEGDIVASLDEAFDTIEAAILPSLSAMLDSLLDAASLGRPGVDAAAYAANLKQLANELQSLTRQVEAVAQPRLPLFESYAAASAA